MGRHWGQLSRAATLARGQGYSKVLTWGGLRERCACNDKLGPGWRDAWLNGEHKQKELCVGEARATHCRMVWLWLVVLAVGDDAPCHCAKDDAGAAANCAPARWPF